MHENINAIGREIDECMKNNLCRNTNNNKCMIGRMTT